MLWKPLPTGVLQQGPTVPKLDDHLRIKEAAEDLGVCQNTLRNWQAAEKISEAAQYPGVSRNTICNWRQAGKIAIHSNPMKNYRLFENSDLQDPLWRIEESGEYPIGWQRSAKSSCKPR